MTVILIFLVALITIFNLIIYGLMFWSGANHKDAGITSSQGVITKCVAITAILIQLAVTIYHISIL